MSVGPEHGLGFLMAVIFLSGEMAGVGVLAMPKSMVGTGPAGFALIIYFTLNAMFAGSRLGLCWVMICERWEEYKEGSRSPYMVIAEKATERWGRTMIHITSACVIVTLYGSCCVILVLMGDFLNNIANELGLNWSPCEWMMIVACCLAPLCMFGSPADFWFVAVGALISTVGGCIIVLVKEGIDVSDKGSCLYESEPDWSANHPAPESALGFGKAFSSLMFAFAGASTFPTIQADMKDKSQFPKAVVIAMTVLCCIYLPMSAVSWGLLGDKVGSSVIDSLCDGPVKISVEILFLLHLITAFPILMNPPNQFFEGLFKIPPKFCVSRVAFRLTMIALMLLLGLSLPVFGAILDLIGATTITSLNFIFPPLFYLLLADSTGTDKKYEPRPVPKWVRIYSWHMVIVGIAGGVLSFISAVLNVKKALSEGESCWLTMFD